MFILVTGEPGSGRHFYNETEAEAYITNLDQSVYNFPFKGFEIKSAKEVELHRLGNTRKSGMYQVTIENTYDKSELINKYIPKLKNSLLIIPACPAYMELIQVALAYRIEKDNDVLIIRDTIKDFNKITNIIPDVFRIHADNTLAIHKVYASELYSQIGSSNTYAFLLAQWFVNKQSACNKLSTDENYKFGYYLCVNESKIITTNDLPDAELNLQRRSKLREDILFEGLEMMKVRFDVSESDEEIRETLLNLLD
jgi:hypothetical protein